MATNKPTTLEHLTLLAQRTQAELAERDARIDGIVNAGGEPNVLEGVKVNGVALTPANKIVDIEIEEGTTDGTISVNNVDVAVKGLAALITAVNTLKGTGDGSVTKIVNNAINTFATEVSNDNAVNKFAEIITWIANHPDAAQLVSDLDDLEKLVGTLPTSANSETIVAYIGEAITNALANYYTQTEIGNGYVAKVSGKGLSTNDYTTTEKNKLSGIAANATKVEASTTNGKIKINGTETTVYTEPSDVLHGTWATNTEVNTMLTSVFGA